MKQVGDGFFVVFEAPSAAMDCAVAIQRSLAARRREEASTPEVRIGIHEAEVTRKGRDYQGEGVHQAARIGAIGGAGEIVASRATVTGVRPVPVSEPWAVTLKGIAVPVQVVSIYWEESAPS